MFSITNILPIRVITCSIIMEKLSTPVPVIRCQVYLNRRSFSNLFLYALVFKQYPQTCKVTALQQNYEVTFIPSAPVFTAGSAQHGYLFLYSLPGIKQFYQIIFFKSHI